jgi:outer membrane protein assembly factor BamB
MPRNPQFNVFIGIKGAVIALDDRTGSEVWRADLRGSEFVTVLWDGTALFAATGGEVWRLDPKSGDAIWHNELKRLGRGLASLASSRRGTDDADSVLVAEKLRRDAEAAAG